MLINQPRTSFPISAGFPGGLDQHFDRASGRYSEQAKAKKAAKLAHTTIAQAFAACWTDGEPNFIARRFSI